MLLTVSMQKSDLDLDGYDYHLPEELIASRPLSNRDESKLLVYNVSEDKITHTSFKELPSFLSSEDLLVLNQTKVFPCKLFGNKQSGGQAEIFILSLTPSENGFECLIKSRGKKNLGDQYYVKDLGFSISSIENNGTFFIKPDCSIDNFYDFLETHAKVPIPPYIRGGNSDEQDKLDYQTIYAKNSGSVAAPTAGLHFTDSVFEGLINKGVEKTFVTLHVGLGTFRPVQSDNIKDHQMHSELFEIENEAALKLNNSKNIIAVGTTSLRVLESQYSVNGYKESKGETDIFLYPGKEVRSIGGLITNFHLPKSSLIMLVSAIIGREKTLELYQEAIKNNYRFFSYGDAMFIQR